MAEETLCHGTQMALFMNFTPSLPPLFLNSWCFQLVAQSASHMLTLVPCSWIFLPWRWRWHVPPKRLFIHGVTSKKTAFFIVTAVKTSNPIILLLVYFSYLGLPGYDCVQSGRWYSTCHLGCSISTSLPLTRLYSIWWQHDTRLMKWKDRRKPQLQRYSDICLEELRENQDKSQSG
jgi:hypothetical protein